MKKRNRYLGLDVHADSIAVAVAEAGRNGEVRSIGTVPNTPQAVRRLITKLSGADGLRACYEAGPCGYALYWELTRIGVACEVIAPTLIPVKAGDRVKTDREPQPAALLCMAMLLQGSMQVSDAEAVRLNRPGISGDWFI